MRALRQMDLTCRAGVSRLACLLRAADPRAALTAPAGGSAGRGLFGFLCGFPAAADSFAVGTSGRGDASPVSPAPHSAGVQPHRFTSAIYRGGGSDPQKAARSSLLIWRAVAALPRPRVLEAA